MREKRETPERWTGAMTSAAAEGMPPRRINEKEPEPELAPPCPERGPEAGRPPTGAHYFKPLSRTIQQYVDHPEYKYKGNEGFLEQKHIHVS